MSYWWCERAFWHVSNMHFQRITHPCTPAGTTAPGRLLRTVSGDVAWKLRSNVSWASLAACNKETWICVLLCFQKFQTCFFLGRFGNLSNYINSRKINVDQRVLLDRYRMALWANLRACHYFIRLLSDKGILQRPADARDTAMDRMGSLFGWFFWMFHSMATTPDHRQTTWTLRCIIGNYGEFLSFGTSWHSVWFALFFVQKDLLCMVDFGKLLAFGTYTDCSRLHLTKRFEENSITPTSYLRMVNSCSGPSMFPISHHRFLPIKQKELSPRFWRVIYLS